MKATEARLGGLTALNANLFIRKTRFGSYFCDCDLRNIISIIQYTTADPRLHNIIGYFEIILREAQLIIKTEGKFIL